MLDSILDTIVETLIEDEDVKLVNFGIFSINTRGRRTGINPKTKGPLAVFFKTVSLRHRAVVLRSSDTLKGAVNQ